MGRISWLGLFVVLIVNKILFSLMQRPVHNFQIIYFRKVLNKDNHSMTSLDPLFSLLSFLFSTSSLLACWPC